MDSFVVRLKILQKNSKLLFSLIFSVAALASFVVFLTLQSSYSANEIDNVTEKMSSSDGLTTITITGESSKKIEQDQVTIVMNVQTKPSDLKSIETAKKESVDKVTNAIESSLDENSTLSVTTGNTNLNGLGYGGAPPDMSSFTAHVEFPITVDLDKLTTVSKIITDNGFWINNLSVQKVPIDSSETTSEIIVSSGSSTPGCESANSCYLPYNKVVKAKEMVTWINNDSAAHTVTSGKVETSPSGLFDSGLFIAGGKFQYVFETPGEYDYFCMVHPWMTGKVTVISAETTESEKPEIQYKYQANLNAVMDLEPDNINNVVEKYQSKIDSLTTALKDYQVPTENIRQGSVYFNPIYYGQSSAKLFTAYTQIFVKVNMQDVEKVMDAAKTSGANFENMFLSYSSSTTDALRQELTQKAIENAQSRAMEIIGPMGLQIKGIKSITVNSGIPQSQYGNTIVQNGIGLRFPYYDTNQANEVFVSATVEFEVGK